MITGLGWILIASTMGHAVAAAFWNSKGPANITLKLSYAGLSALMAIVTAKLVLGFGL